MLLLNIKNVSCFWTIFHIHLRAISRSSALPRYLVGDVDPACCSDNSCWSWQCLWHTYSPRRFNLAPEAESFIHIKFGLSCQGCENVLFQPDGLRSVPAVGGLLSATDKWPVYGAAVQTKVRDCSQVRMMDHRQREKQDKRWELPKQKLPAVLGYSIFEVLLLYFMVLLYTLLYRRYIHAVCQYIQNQSIKMNRTNQTFIHVFSFVPSMKY